MLRRPYIPAMSFADQGTSRGAADPDAKHAAGQSELPPDVPSELTRDMPPRELAARLRGVRPPTVIDVREPWEHRIANIAGARLVPLQTLPAALSTFDPAVDYVLLCHHGVRSDAGLEFLRERGLTRVAHLAGGIDAWSADVDPAVPRY